MWSDHICLHPVAAAGRTPAFIHFADISIPLQISHIFYFLFCHGMSGQKVVSALLEEQQQYAFKNKLKWIEATDGNGGKINRASGAIMEGRRCKVPANIGSVQRINCTFCFQIISPLALKLKEGKSRKQKTWRRAGPKCWSLFRWIIEVSVWRAAKTLRSDKQNNSHPALGKKKRKKKKKLTHNSPQNTNHLFHLHGLDREFFCFWIIHRCVAPESVLDYPLTLVSLHTLLTQSHLVKCIWISQR